MSKEEKPKRCDSTVDFVDAMNSDGKPDTRNQHALTIQAMRKIVDGNCLDCGKEFKGITRKMFCNRKCGRHYRKVNDHKGKFITKSQPQGGA